MFKRAHIQLVKTLLDIVITVISRVYLSQINCVIKSVKCYIVWVFPIHNVHKARSMNISESDWRLH